MDSIVTNQNSQIGLDSEKKKQRWKQYCKDLFSDQRTKEHSQIDKGEKLKIPTKEISKKGKTTKHLMKT